MGELNYTFWEIISSNQIVFLVPKEIMLKGRTTQELLQLEMILLINLLFLCLNQMRKYCIWILSMVEY